VPLLVPLLVPLVPLLPPLLLLLLLLLLLVLLLAGPFFAPSHVQDACPTAWFRADTAEALALALARPIPLQPYLASPQPRLPLYSRLAAYAPRRAGFGRLPLAAFAAAA